ncbi:MAG: HAMP domain-containing protein, partial [Desulfuromonadales bacterium]|nr:HAMP domain-containing protein [Desulfuromonadales bacterium]
MKIGAKLGLGFGLVLLMLLLVSIVGIVQLNSVTTGYQVDVAEEWEGMIRAEVIETNILQMRRHEKDFFARRDMKYVDLLYKEIETTRSNIEFIKQSSPVQEMLVKVSSALSYLNTYKSNFDEIVDAYQRRGLTETEGVEGTFRNAAHAVEAILKENDLAGAEVLYLTMRKHEKDYLLRLDPKYIDSLHATAAELTALVSSNQSLEQGNKRAVNEQIKIYVATFDLLVKEMERITKLQPVIKGAADALLVLAEEILEFEKGMKRDVVAEIDGRSAFAKNLMWIFSAISILVGAVFAFFFARSISQPLGTVVHMIQELEKGHLGTRLNLNRSDEIGQMGATMDAFADSLEN